MFLSLIEQLNYVNWTIELPFVGKLNHCLSPYVRTNAMFETIFGQLSSSMLNLNISPLC